MDQQVSNRSHWRNPISFLCVKSVFFFPLGSDLFWSFRLSSLLLLCLCFLGQYNISVWQWLYWFEFEPSLLMKLLPNARSSHCNKFLILGNDPTTSQAQGRRCMLDNNTLSACGSTLHQVIVHKLYRESAFMFSRCYWAWLLWYMGSNLMMYYI